MSRLMFLLSMLAALAGTPLRQAEAADDLARALAVQDNGGSVATVDGGVGDDAGDALKADVAPSAFDSALHDAVPAPFPNITALLAPVGLSPSLPFRAPPATASRRHALLQSFRF